MESQTTLSFLAAASHWHWRANKQKNTIFIYLLNLFRHYMTILPVYIKSWAKNSLSHLAICIKAKWLLTVAVAVATRSVGLALSEKNSSSSWLLNGFISLLYWFCNNLGVLCEGENQCRGDLARKTSYYGGWVCNLFIIQILSITIKLIVTLFSLI